MRPTRFVSGFPIAGVTAVVGGICGPAMADISQATAPSPGGFLQVGAFAQTCCAPRPGTDIALISASPQVEEDAFLPSETSSLSTTREQPGLSISVSGAGEMGAVRGSISRYAPDIGPFAAGIVNGGWNELFTISHPGHAGQAGVFVFGARVRASMQARDLAGSATCQATVYMDSAPVNLNDLFSRGNADLTISGQQWVQWGVATFAGGEVANREVDGVVTFAVPFTFGQPFKLGVYATATAGQRSSGGFGNSWSTSSVDFSQGMTWNGVGGVYVGGAPVSGSTIASGSGIDWTGAVGGCPADMNGDGFLDFFDYDEFVGAFESGGPGADFNGDGFVDFFDYDEFVGAFEAGC